MNRLFATIVAVAMWFMGQKSIPDVKPPLEILLRCAEYSELSYCDPEVFRKSVDDNVKFYDGNPDEDTQAYSWLCKEDAVVYLVFRGTNSTSDIMADMQINTSPWSEHDTARRVHHGFYDQFHAIDKVLGRDVESYVKEAKKIICTGHSLGGALATIAAAHFAEKYTDVPVCCYTFGSPRVGNRMFADMFHTMVHEHWRVYNECDPVPMLPPMCNFQHTATGFCCGIGTHTMDMYIKNLKKS
jgi:hypothetical protein